TFTGTSGQTFDLTGATALFNGNITVNKTSGTVTLLSDLILDLAGQDLTITSGTLDLGANNLSVIDQLTINGGTLTHGAGTITATNDFVMSSGTFSGGAGTLDINDAFTLSGGTFTAPSGTLFVGGNFTHTAGGTFTHNSGTVTFDSGTDTIDVAVTETFSNVVFANGTKTVASGDTLIVTGTLDLIDGNINTGTVAAQGDITQESTFDGGSGLLLINGTGAQLFTGNATTTVGNIPDVTINKTSGTLTLAGTIRTTGQGAGAWTYTAGTIAPGTSTVVFNSTNTITGSHSLNNVDFRGTTAKTINSGDTLTVLGDLLLEDGSINTGTVDAKGDVTHSALFDGGTGTLSITGAAIRIIDLIGGGEMPNVILNAANVTMNGPAAGTVTFDGGFTVQDGTFVGAAGDLNLNSFFTLEGGSFTAPSGTMFVAGGWTHTLGGVFTHNSGTVIIDGASATFDVVTTETFNNLTFNKSGVSALTISAGDTMIVLGALFFQNGMADTGSVEARGDVTVSSVGYDGGNATLVFGGAAGQLFDITGAGARYNGDIVINKAAGTVTLVGDDLTMNGASQDLTITSGVFDLNGNDLTMTTGGLTINGGTLTQGSGNITTSSFDQSGGTFAVGSGNVDVNGAFAVSGGTFTAPPAGSSFTVSGDLSVTGGVFAPNGGELILDGTGQTLSGSATFNHLTKIAAGPDTLTFEAGSTQTVLGILTLQGTAAEFLKLRSTSSGSQWMIDPQGPRAILYVDVQDSVNMNAAPIDCLSGCLDEGNNINWLFPGSFESLIFSEHSIFNFQLFHPYFSVFNDTQTFFGLLQGRALASRYASRSNGVIDSSPYDELPWVLIDSGWLTR
ncbi:MAG: beta strand repeat-containing protein, partial [Candidatus Omnitrophota bacterium]